MLLPCAGCCVLLPFLAYCLLLPSTATVRPFILTFVVSNYPVVCSQDLQTSLDVPFESQPLDGEVADAAVVLDEDGKELGPAPKSRKKQSAVWNFYGPRYTFAKDGRVCVKCRLCEEEFAYVNTTNMQNHLLRKHKGDVLQDMITGKNVSRLLSCLVFPIFYYNKY